MKRKVMIGSILAVLMLVIISLSTAVSTETNTQTKESPLYKIRTKEAIKAKIETLKVNIKTKFISEDRIFFAPILHNIIDRKNLGAMTCISLTCPCTGGVTPWYCFKIGIKNPFATLS